MHRSTRLYSKRKAQPSRIGKIGILAAVGAAYFLAARLGLALLTQPDGVAVFWPAAGIASGALIAFRFGARLPVALGVLATSVAASLLGDRNLASAIVFGLCNTGEALLVAWLINDSFGRDFRLESLRSVLGFFAAAGIGAASSGIVATVGFVVFHASDAPILTTWLKWFASDALGIVTVAPLVIGLVRSLDDVPEAPEFVEGILALTVLVAISAVSFGAPPGYWFTILPLSLLLPLLLWPAARCRPVFAAAAVFILSLVIVWTMTFGVGRLGDPSIPLAERVHAARAALLVISMTGLALAALFVERKLQSTVLKDSGDRLQLALDGAGLGVWSIDAKTGSFENDVRDRRIHGHDPHAPPATLAEARAFIHPEDLPRLDAAFEAAGRIGGSYKVEYRLAPMPVDTHPCPERWVAVEGTIVRSAKGERARLLGVTRDITGPKQAEDKLQKSERAFRELLEALPAAVYVTDVEGRITYHNTAAIALWGVAPELGKSKFCGSWKLYAPDGTPIAPHESPTAIALDRKKPIRGGEAIAERPDGTRVPIIPYPTPLFDASGALTGAVNMLVDITERKHAEWAIAERDTQLALAEKVALVGSFTFDIASGEMQISPGYAAIHGLPEGTRETRRCDWRTRVLPDDLPRLDMRLQRAIAAQDRDHHCEFRIIRSSGDIRWIEARSSISYDHAGIAQRIVGTNIDVTERKLAEAGLRESENRLADALEAGQVIAFEWDAATRRSRRSNNAALILGYEEGAGVPGAQCEDFFGKVHPDDRECFKAHIRELCIDKPSYALSFRFCSPDGRQLWLEETAKGEFDAAGRLLRVRGLTRNITERKIAEHALAERNMQLSLAGKAALVGSFAYDIDSEEIQVSAGYSALHGLPDGTTHITRRMWQMGLHPDDLERVEELRNHVFRDRGREYGTEYRIVRSGAELRWIEARCFVSYGIDGLPQRVVGVNIDITGRKRADEHQRVLVAELDHRVKNVLATVSAVAAHTLDTSSSMDDFVAALDGRIRSMATTHELLSGRRWKGIPLAELLRHQLAPYATSNNMDVKGPDVLLSADAGQSIGMVLHELITNAAKYGALSTRDGRISVRWYWPLNGKAPDRLVIEWQEIGGPGVEASSKSSYGTSVIADLVPYELGGTTDLVLAPDGVRCRINIPAKWVSSERRPWQAGSEAALVEGAVSQPA